MQFGFCTQGILLMTAGFGTGGGGRCALMFLRMCVRALTACPCLRGLHVYFQYNGWAGVVLGEFSRGLNIGISKKKKKKSLQIAQRLQTSVVSGAKHAVNRRGHNQVTHT